MRAPQDPSPAEMPGQYWGYFVPAVLLGVPLGVVVAYITLAHTAPVRDLARLPVVHSVSEARAADPQGAAFAGALSGPAGRFTPMGRPAALWVAWVTVARKSGKSTTTSTSCARRAIDGLALAQGAQLTPLAPETLARAEYTRDGEPWSLGHVGRVRTLLQTESALETGEIPAGYLASCFDAPSNRAEGTWLYHEVLVAPGAPVELAACVRDGQLAPCRDGVASGHLASGRSIRVLARSVATRTMAAAALLTGIVSFFTVVSLYGALRALRRAPSRRPARSAP